MSETQQSIADKYDLFVCIQCGKCTGGCPVNLKSTLNIRRLIRETTINFDLDVIYEQKALWDCTTCSTCTLRCPRGIKPHELIMGMRAALIEEGRVPVTIRDSLEGVFKHGNPWSRVRSKRSEWADGLEIKDLSQGDTADVLYFVCCAASYDPRVQEVARSITRILSEAGVNFGILGNKENCCGSEVRRMGEEGLFEMLAEDNLKLFYDYGVRNIVTTSPHCYNIFKNEYQTNEIEVKHYTQYLAELISQGRLTLSNEINKIVTYHDPCFLGKQNGIYDEPRNVIKSIPGINFIELDRSRERSLCCEGGGGRMWMEASDESAERLAEIRIKNAVETGAEIIATACPFCLLNLEDAVKTTGLEDRIQIKDIAELVLIAL